MIIERDIKDNYILEYRRGSNVNCRFIISKSSFLLNIDLIVGVLLKFKDRFRFILKISIKL